MSIDNSEKLKRFNISGIPVIKSASEMLGLKSIFSKYITSYGNETVASVDAFLFLVWNITLGRQFLCELSQWIADIEPKCHGLDRQQLSSFNDDRFARALDKLYEADRPTLMTDIVVMMIK